MGSPTARIDEDGNTWPNRANRLEHVALADNGLLPILSISRNMRAHSHAVPELVCDGPAVAKIAASFSPSARQIAVALDGSTGSNRLSCQPSPVTPGLRRMSGLRQCRPRWPSARWYWIDDPEGVSIPLRYSTPSMVVTGRNVSTLMVGRGRGRGAGGGIQGIDWDLLRFSAARMSDWEHPCDQHLAQARSPMKPTETDGFFPWWTGHFKRLVPCPATSCGVK